MGNSHYFQSNLSMSYLNIYPSVSFEYIFAKLVKSFSWGVKEYLCVFLFHQSINYFIYSQMLQDSDSQDNYSYK